MAPVSTSSPIFAARSFPTPCSSRRSADVRPATRRVSWATVSAAFRYARILKGFSPLISRRSPISARMRAIARLSIGGDLEQKAGETAYSPRQNSLKRIDYQAAGLDGEVQHLGAGVGEHLANGVGRIRPRRRAERAAPPGGADA